MGNGFAGVDLDNIEIPNEAPSAPEQEQISEPRGEDKEAKSPTPAEIVELDKLERFRFDGRDLTPKQLKDEFMMRSDYTRKTQELSEARKFADNFEADLDAVMANPQLLSKLKEIYPPAYVKLAEKALSGRAVTAEDKSDLTQSLPPRLQTALEKIERYEKAMSEQQTQASLETLNSHHEQMSKKYPFADPDVVDSRLQVLIEKGADITRENLGRVIENAYKQHHQAVESRINAQRKSKVEEQVTAGKKARDVGPNGSPLGDAPKKWKSIQDSRSIIDAAFPEK